jgi:anti-sigma factor ChrR (cupin superfamily)
MSTFDRDRCEQSEVTCTYALQVLPASEAAAAEAHIAACPDCQRELESLRPVLDRFVSWPTDVLRPATSLQGRLALRIAEETGKQPVLPPERQWSEPDWEQVAPGIECKLLAADAERHRVSMLVRLAPGASYPTHTHAGVEVLHLLAFLFVTGYGRESLPPAFGTVAVLPKPFSLHHFRTGHVGIEALSRLLAQEFNRR